ncbi:hypothetical protein [Pseudochryseolinea flava]|uniref:Uncharacterized protein n=1 Tax=Pseudochryseolinea flava TaxID=2059302 RepID=A0A364XVU0_9BACT|nr:hypothetical protein [Pseudochryseolinea flava]RAV98236.1 hypothetical protein DQQ10_24860 [Pseudochryseolinea flava]
MVKKKKSLQKKDRHEPEVPKDLHDLSKLELSGSSDNDTVSLSATDTDEDENEGLGDGNMGGRRLVKKP